MSLETKGIDEKLKTVARSHTFSAVGGTIQSAVRRPAACFFSASGRTTASNAARAAPMSSCAASIRARTWAPPIAREAPCPARSETA